MSHFDLKAMIASQGYHVYKKTAWLDAKVKIEIETNQNLIAVDPYACAVKAKHKDFDGLKTVGHISR